MKNITTLKNVTFQPPSDVHPWKNIKTTTKHGNVCPQLTKLILDGEFIGKEDCLFINVYTPVVNIFFIMNCTFLWNIFTSFLFVNYIKCDCFLD